MTRAEAEHERREPLHGVAVEARSSSVRTLRCPVRTSKVFAAASEREAAADRSSPGSCHRLSAHRERYSTQAAEDVRTRPSWGVGEALEQPQAREPGAIRVVPHAVLGETRIPGPVIHVVGEAPTPVRVPPILGEHADAVLRDVLGLPDNAVRALVIVIDGVVGTGGTARAGPSVGPPTS